MPIDRDHAFAGGAVFPRRGGAWFVPAWAPLGRARAAWVQFDRGAEVAANCQLGPNAWCVNALRERARIQLAEGVICRGLLRVEEFGDGRIALGKGVYIGDDCLLSSAAGITLGERVMLAHGVQIFDNDSHPVELAARRADFQALLTGGPRAAIERGAISIGDDAWIGLEAIILKGVTIGAGSVIAAGSIVSSDIPAHSVAAGNPARVVKTLPTP